MQNLNKGVYTNYSIDPIDTTKASANSNHSIVTTLQIQIHIANLFLF